MQRLIIGMSQPKLAEKMEITFQQVQKYENGKNRVSASRLQQISRTLRVRLEFFFEEARGAGNNLAIAKGPRSLISLSRLEMALLYLDHSARLLMPRRDAASSLRSNISLNSNC
jgi:transcriptional regulator with XRE-family HTH domain